MTARRMKAMRFDKDTIKAVSRLVELHLRFHGYGDGEWTDSAVRRYVTDAGPLLPRLHRLTRSDCTTRNVRKARSLSRIYDDLETRIARLLEQEQLDAVRPELDGNEIAEILGITRDRCWAAHTSTCLPSGWTRVSSVARPRSRPCGPGGRSSPSRTPRPEHTILRRPEHPDLPDHATSRMAFLAETCSLRQRLMRCA